MIYVNLNKAIAMKLYKFRPLANQTDFDRAKAILETGCFWCSKFFDLNDPMEGVYKGIKNYFAEKDRYKICSFSGKKAFRDPVMWAYYANGFKGMAIETAICNETKVKAMEYIKVQPTEDKSIDEILNS